MRVELAARVGPEPRHALHRARQDRREAMAVEHGAVRLGHVEAVRAVRAGRARQHARDRAHGDLGDGPRIRDDAPGLLGQRLAAATQLALGLAEGGAARLQRLPRAAEPVALRPLRLGLPVQDRAGGRHLLLDLGAERRAERLTLVGKPTHFLQLFQNLLANALKFHRAGVPPVVRVESSAGDDGAAVVAFVDNGIGMRAEDTSEIFGVFQRLNGRGEFEGSGIGLATVRRILDELGAEIVVSSEVGRGSRFEVRVPEARVIGGPRGTER